MRGFFSAAISENISRTPEGYLIAHDVPIARTGSQVYRKGELEERYAQQWSELDDGDSITLHKTKDELFHSDTVASYNGKPVTNLHPPKLFDISDHDEYDCGHVINPRPGTEPESDGNWYLRGDLFITDETLADEVESGRMRQVSCGSDNSIMRREDGDGEQKDIRGNHVAVVPKGRAGPLAGIRDHAVSEDALIIREKLSMNETLMNLLGLGIKEHSKTATPADLAGLLSLGNLNKRRGSQDEDTPDTQPSEEVKALKERIASLEAEIATMKEHMGKASEPGKSADDEDTGTDDEKKDKDDDSEGTEDEIPTENVSTPSDRPIDAIKKAGSMDALVTLKPLALKSKSVKVKNAWNARRHELKGTGTADAAYGNAGQAATGHVDPTSGKMTAEQFVAAAQEEYRKRQRV